MKAALGIGLRLPRAGLAAEEAMHSLMGRDFLSHSQTTSDTERERETDAADHRACALATLLDCGHWSA